MRNTSYVLAPDVRRGWLRKTKWRLKQTGRLRHHFWVSVHLYTRFKTHTYWNRYQVKPVRVETGRTVGPTTANSGWRFPARQLMFTPVSQPRFRQMPHVSVQAKRIDSLFILVLVSHSTPSPHRVLIPCCVQPRPH